MLPFSPQVPNFLMSQVRRLNENSNRRYQFKNLLRKIQPDSREKPEKNSEVSLFSSSVDFKTLYNHLNPLQRLGCTPMFHPR